jgi:hypothetical protein
MARNDRDNLRDRSLTSLCEKQEIHIDLETNQSRDHQGAEARHQSQVCQRLRALGCGPPLPDGRATSRGSDWFRYRLLFLFFTQTLTV